MRHVAAGLAALALATGAIGQRGAVAQEAGDAGAIAAVIGDQLQDFNARDVAGAWEHASPVIQRIFGTPENFGLMVETGYPMVWTNDGADFLDLRAGPEGRLWQRVRLRDAQGVPHLLDYLMVETPGGWLIDAVALLPAPDVGV